MLLNIGSQYNLDDPFKAAARLHQSKYRARVLQVDSQDYGNRLTDVDGFALLNYYDELGVREVKRERYPLYSKKRDADLLRSEHIPFNMFAPLTNRTDLTKLVLNKAFGLKLSEPFQIKLECAPSPSEKYLDDMTSFDTYIQARDVNGETVGVGIEVKYTERGYRMGKRESVRMHDQESSYWATARQSGLFISEGSDKLIDDDLRQIWRNHLLGLSMVQNNDIARFVSVTLYPAGNEHFTRALAKYQTHLEAKAREDVRGCSFEHYISSLGGSNEIDAWRDYLAERYLFTMPT